MTRIELREALAPEDHDRARALCETFRDWLRVRYADHPVVVGDYYGDAAWAPLMADLPTLHAPPEGAILLAFLDGRLAGCTMLRALPEPGLCEMKRMYVEAFARGTGVASALVEGLCDLARARGYRTMRLDTGRLQVEAQALYRRSGFVERGPYYDPPENLCELLVYFERAL
ncbi:GNAT family N-acetyltransferase [Albimonas sp. CAU 1670]|uniref:GNAT family N-acetyltransferase n=1 Tax=Albimonas sp. CAU 1670 TaxID=3032599 RepID=UPI0023DA1742|nr:GNAT family N-acetyltransferase [Albimonas sp. CAU 1670]MDF2233119.1 GNAT family N-acetyltransferase [Albimonas sp. CAU 1670]